MECLGGKSLSSEMCIMKRYSKLYPVLNAVFWCHLPETLVVGWDTASHGLYSVSQHSYHLKENQAVFVFKNHKVSKINMIVAVSHFVLEDNEKVPSHLVSSVLLSF